MPHRFFIDGVYQAGDVVDVAGTDAHKIINVLRLHAGDSIEVIDSAARAFDAAIVNYDRAVRVELRNELAAPERDPLVRIDVAQAIPKGQKMDFVVEKLTELGASSILPLYTERSIAHATDAKLDRWQRLARTAAQQCGRRDVPPVGKPVDFATVLRDAQTYDRILIPWELASAKALRDALPALLNEVRRVLVIIGPEGGFSHDEIETAQASGARAISLGRRILRTETAALALVAAINYQLGM